MNARMSRLLGASRSGCRLRSPPSPLASASCSAPRSLDGGSLIARSSCARRSSSSAARWPPRSSATRRGPFSTRYAAAGRDVRSRSEESLDTLSAQLVALVDSRASARSAGARARDRARPRPVSSQRADAGRRRRLERDAARRAANRAARARRARRGCPARDLRGRGRLRADARHPRRRARPDARDGELATPRRAGRRHRRRRLSPRSTASASPTCVLLPMAGRLRERAAWAVAPARSGHRSARATCSAASTPAWSRRRPAASPPLPRVDEIAASRLAHRGGQ